MSRVVKNQAQMRASTRDGSPKKNAACRSFSNRNGGMRPGLVSTCQMTKTSASTSACQRIRFFELGLIACHMSIRLRLLRVSLEHFVAQDIPDRPVQLDELRQYAYFGNIA